MTPTDRSESTPDVAYDIDTWVARVCEALKVDATLVPVGTLLSMTKRVAHEAIRPGAPLSCFIAGLAVGQGRVANTDEAIATITGLLEGKPHSTP